MKTQRRTNLLSILTSALICGTALSLSAATLTVTSTADAGPGSLRAALAEAGDGDTINFSVTGTIALTSGELVVPSDLAIVGPGAALLAVDGNGASRVLRVSSNIVVGISGLTVTNAQATPASSLGKGGAIYSERAEVTVSNCALLGNSAIRGGAIYNEAGTLLVVHCLIAANIAEDGGGIYNDASSANAKAAVVECTLTRNTGSRSDSLGGSIFNWGTLGEAELVVAGCTISDSSADGGGGGIANWGNGGKASAQIVNSTLSGNSVKLWGGAILNLAMGTNGSAEMTIVNATISSNSASRAYSSYGGGGIYNFDVYDGNASVELLNSTFSGNSVSSLYGDGIGGGIFNQHDSASAGAAAVSIGSTLFAASVSGANIANDAGTITSLGYNLSSDAAGGALSAGTDRTNIDPMLGPLQNNGGPTPTHSLPTNSPALDQGKNFGGLATDQRQDSFNRTSNDPAIADADGGDGTDIGAFEVQPSHNSPPVADASATPNVVVSANGVDALVLLDGSRSSDPDGDPLQFFWSPAGSSDLLATGATATVTLPVGAHSLVLVITDGLATDSTSLSVEVVAVPNPLTQLEGLIAAVKAKVPRSQPLLASLNAAAASMKRGNNTAAVNQTDAFIKKVRVQLRSNPALAAALINSAQETKAGLQASQ